MLLEHDCPAEDSRHLAELHARDFGHSAAADDAANSAQCSA